MKKYNLAPGDFPDIRDFQDKLSELDFSKFHGLKQKLIDDVETVLANDIPRLMGALPRYALYIHTLTHTIHTRSYTQYTHSAHTLSLKHTHSLLNTHTLSHNHTHTHSLS